MIVSWVRATVLACGLLAAGTIVAMAAQVGELERLLAEFRAMPGLEADFVETKELSILLLPLRSEGKLYFDPEGVLARWITEPAPSVFVIMPGRIEYRMGAEARSVDLSAAPEVARFVSGLAGVFAGDREALERGYRIALEGGLDAPQGWALTLSPRWEKGRDLAASIHIEGRGGIFARMVVVQKNGDRATTVFEAVNSERRFDAAERKRFFSIDEAH